MRIVLVEIEEERPNVLEWRLKIGRDIEIVRNE